MVEIKRKKHEFEDVCTILALADVFFATFGDYWITKQNMRIYKFEWKSL